MSAQTGHRTDRVPKDERPMATTNTTLPLDNFNAGARAILVYMWNTNGDRFVDDVFGVDVAPSYRREKADAWGRSPLRAINALDLDNMRKIFAIARERHAR